MSSSVASGEVTSGDDNPIDLSGFFEVEASSSVHDEDPGPALLVSYRSHSRSSDPTPLLRPSSIEPLCRLVQPVVCSRCYIGTWANNVAPGSAFTGSQPTSPGLPMPPRSPFATSSAGSSQEETAHGDEDLSPPKHGIWTDRSGQLVVPPTLTVEDQPYHIGGLTVSSKSDHGTGSQRASMDSSRLQVSHSSEEDAHPCEFWGKMTTNEQLLSLQHGLMEFLKV